MNLPNQRFHYDPSAERERNRAIEQADKENFKRGRDLRLVRERLILQAPDGGFWQVTVDNAGALSATSVP